MDRQERLSRLRALSPAQREHLVCSLGVGATVDDAAPLAVPHRADASPCQLSFAQRRLWYLERLMPGSPAYHVPFALRLDGTLDPTALAWGLAEIARRHEVLRMRIRIDETGEPLQDVAPGTELSLRHVDLSGFGRPQRAAQLDSLAVAEARMSFDLADGPLVRATLVHCGPSESVLLLTLHHIASDGWSDGVLLYELSELYRAALAGQPSPLVPLPIQYADFAVWQRQSLQGPALERLLAYWRQQLAGAPPLLDLPTDRPRTVQRSDRGATSRLSLSAALAGEIAHFGRKQGLTDFMVLLGAFQDDDHGG